MHDIMEIVKSLEESGLLRKGVSGTTQNEAKKNPSRCISQDVLRYIRC